MISSAYSNGQQIYPNARTPSLLKRSTKAPLLLFLLSLDIRKDLTQKVLGEPRGLLIRLLEARLAAVVRILDHLGLVGARVLAKKHHLGFSGVALLETLEVGQVGSVHGEDVVELVEVGGADLLDWNAGSQIFDRFERGLGVCQPTTDGVGEAYLASGVDIIGYSVLSERLHRSVVGAFANVVGAWESNGVSIDIRTKEQKAVWGSGKGVPVPHESIFAIRPLYSGFLAIDWKTPSAIVERQMLPRQTKRTEIWSDILADIMACDGSLKDKRLWSTNKLEESKLESQTSSTTRRQLHLQQQPPRIMEGRC